MNPPNVEIGELRLRVVGLTREQAQRLGGLVAHCLAQSVYGKRLPAGSVDDAYVGVRAGGSLERIADEVVRGIVRKVG